MVPVRSQEKTLSYYLRACQAGPFATNSPAQNGIMNQSPKKLLDVAEDVRLLGVNKVSVPIKRKVMILN